MVAEIGVDQDQPNSCAVLEGRRARNDELITLYEATGTAQLLASEGDGKGFSNFGRVSVSQGGQIAFQATYESPSGDRRYGIFRGFNGAADKIIAEGDRLTYDGAEWEISLDGFGPRGVLRSRQGTVVDNSTLRSSVWVPDGSELW